MRSVRRFREETAIFIDDRRAPDVRFRPDVSTPEYVRNKTESGLAGAGR